MSDDGNIVSIEKVEKYLELTLEARNKATPITNNVEDEHRLSVMLKMCDDYQNDARYFLNNGDLVRAFGAINYACLLYTSPSPRDGLLSRMPSSA